MIRLAIVVTCLALAGCAARLSPKTVDPGAEVTLAPGESVAVNHSATTVRFVAVTEDSRCPPDTTCIWAGEARAQLEINGAPVEIAEGGSTVAGAGRVTLVRITPQPIGTARIAPRDYRATLKIEN